MNCNVRRTATATCGVRRTAIVACGVRRTAYGVELKRWAWGVMLAASAMLVPSALRAQDTGLTLGSTAPSAMLETLDGKPMDLAQVVKGGPAVIGIIG